MIYAFVQDGEFEESADKQKETICAFAESNALSVASWIYAEKFSARHFKENDVVLIEKTSRLGNGISSVLKTLQNLLHKGVTVLSCADGKKFGGDYVSATSMAYAFSMVTEIVAEVRSQTTKKGLKQAREQGATLGRPKGAKNSRHKWDNKKKQILDLFKSGKNKAEICRELNMPRSSLYCHIKVNPELKKYINA